MIIYKINFILLIFSSVSLLFTLWNLIIERKKRASIILIILFPFNFIMWSFLILNVQIALIYFINLIIIIFISIFILISFISYFPKQEQRNLSKIIQYNEKNIMFARDSLDSFPELYSKYYKEKPENEIIDKKIHQKGSLTDKSKVYYDKYLTTIYDSAFTFLDKERKNLLIEKDNNKTEIDKTIITKTIKEIAKIYGAIDIGITKLKPYHFYSHKGRQPEGWGDKIINDHHYGIAIIVPMNIDMINKAPTVYTTIESSKAYVEAAKIAYIIETYIKKFGYDAKSHTDGNYETLCVPIAIDAGIGELSRMGIMIHKEFGPCIRISIITTDMNLIPTKGKTQHIDSFCNICKKCADNCPSNAISKKNESKSRGFTHWSINQEKCFSFWKSIGTDCGFCLKVCPYTKPNTLFHKIIRFYISRNQINQHIALFFDDILFGRKFKIPASNKIVE